MATVGLGFSVLLICCAAAHILEEAFKGFTEFLNMEWFHGTTDCPVGKFKGLYFDKIGLFAGILITAVLAASHDGRWIFIPVGIILADCIQHFAFSIAKRAYTPGVATSVLYLALLVYCFSTFGGPTDVPGWIALLLGVGFIAGNYLLASTLVRRGRCSPAAA
jgi:hypothetical protein